MKHLQTKIYRLAAVLTTAVLTSESTMALANNVNFSNVTKNITGSASTLPNLISSVAYIGGVGMGVAGIFKLKQHVDSPGNAPMKDGLVRLGAGGALLALPYMTQAMMGTIQGGSKGQGPSSQDVQFHALSF